MPGYSADRIDCNSRTIRADAVDVRPAKRDPGRAAARYLTVFSRAFHLRAERRSFARCRNPRGTGVLVCRGKTKPGRVRAVRTAKWKSLAVTIRVTNSSFLPSGDSRQVGLAFRFAGRLQFARVIAFAIGFIAFPRIAGLSDLASTFGSALSNGYAFWQPETYVSYCAAFEPRSLFVPWDSAHRHGNFVAYAIAMVVSTASSASSIWREIHPDVISRALRFLSVSRRGLRRVGCIPGDTQEALQRGHDARSLFGLGIS